MNILNLAITTFSLYAVVLSFFLAFFIIFRNPKKPINQSFAILCLALSVWVFSLFASLNFGNSALSWARLSYVAQIIIILDAWLLSFLYPSKQKSLITAAAIIGTTYFIIFLILIFFTPFWFNPQGGLGNAYFLFVPFSWLPISWTIINFYQKLEKTLGLEKVQLKYILFSYTAWALGVNFVTPFFNINGNSLAYFAFSCLSSLILSIAIFYAIARYRLLDIRFLVSKAIVYGILTIVVLSGYTVIIFLIGLYFYQAHLSPANLLITLSLTLLVTLTIIPIKNFLEKITQRTILKNKILVNQALAQFSTLFLASTDLKSFAISFCQQLNNKLKIEKAHLVFRLEQSLKILPTHNFRLENQDFNQLLKTNRQVLIFDELENETIKNIFRQNQSYYAYIYQKKKISAIMFLGYKLNGEIYFDDERSFLSFLLPQFFLTLEKVLAVNRLKNFNQILAKKVNQATLDLRKNIHLKDELISIVSHELSLPMAAVADSLSTVLEGLTGKLPQKAKDFLQAIYNENARLIRLTKNLLSISRIKSNRLQYELEKFNPQNLVQEVTELMTPLVLEKNLKIKTEIKNPQLKVVADRDKLKEILINLVDNSLRYGQKGLIRVGYNSDKKQMRFFVSDTGPGFSIQQQKNLFKDVDLLDKKNILNKQNRGLGLYICSNLLKGMKGKISLKSEPKKGATVSFWLPLA